jgi:regulator of sigma E protease
LKDDKIIAVGSTPTPYYIDVTTAIKSSPGKTIDVTVLRRGEEKNLSVTVGDDGKIGIGNKNLDYFFEFEKVEYGLGESIPAGISEGYTTLTSYVKSLRHIFSKEGAQSLGGFGAIGGLFPKTWDWEMFWKLTAFLSIILAFMNILPIPALDGGHVMFLMYEIVTGRKPGDKFMEYAQMAGMIFLIALLVFANANDILKLF